MVDEGTARNVVGCKCLIGTRGAAVKRDAKFVKRDAKFVKRDAKYVKRDKRLIRAHSATFNKVSKHANRDERWGAGVENHFQEIQ